MELGGGQGVTCGHQNGGHDRPLEVQLWELKASTTSSTMPEQTSSLTACATGSVCRVGFQNLWDELKGCSGPRADGFCWGCSGVSLVGWDDPAAEVTA